MSDVNRYIQKRAQLWMMYDFQHYNDMLMRLERAFKSSWLVLKEHNITNHTNQKIIRYKMEKQIPRYIVWSTDHLDLDDPFQKRWLLRQILMHGRDEDIHALDLNEVEQEINHLDLPTDIDSLWRSFLEQRHGSK